MDVVDVKSLKAKWDQRRLQHKLLMEELNEKETLAKIETYQAMTRVINERLEDIKWKGLKADFVKSYEKARRDNIFEKMEKCTFKKPESKPDLISGRSLEELIELKKSLTQKLEEREQEYKEKEQRVAELERTVEKLRAEREAKIEKLIKELEEKEEEEKRLEETLKELEREEERLDLALK